MKINDQAVKPARSLADDAKYVRNSNWNTTQPCSYNDDDHSRWMGLGRKMTDDLLKWFSGKQGNRNS